MFNDNVQPRKKKIKERCHRLKTPETKFRVNPEIYKTLNRFKHEQNEWFCRIIREHVSRTFKKSKPLCLMYFGKKITTASLTVCRHAGAPRKQQQIVGNRKQQAESHDRSKSCSAFAGLDCEWWSEAWLNRCHSNLHH